MSHVSYECHMNDSCLIWMIHVSYEWVTSHMNDSCLIWMSHISYECVMSHTNESCLICMRHDSTLWGTQRGNHISYIWFWMSHVSYVWFISHIYESCFTARIFFGIQRVSNPSTGTQRISTPAHSFVVQIGKVIWFGVNGTNQTKDCIWVEAPLLIGFLGGMNDFWYQGVMSHIYESCLTWGSHVSYIWVMYHMKESCLIWMSHVSHEGVMSDMNESCLIWMSPVPCVWVFFHMNDDRNKSCPSCSTNNILGGDQAGGRSWFSSPYY